ncbi:MAG: signal peptidase I [bacterium]
MWKFFKTKKIIFDFLETIVIAVAISAVLYLTILVPNQVEGESMEPNFHNNELILTNKVVSWLGPTALGKKIKYDYQRGDVVILRSNNNFLIKRIIAKAGDTIEIKNNKVYINNNELEESYIPLTTRTQLYFAFDTLFNEGEKITVPADHYFVMGDNRENSKDSRMTQVGFIPRDHLIGKVFFRYWPLADIGIIHRGDYQELSIKQINLNQ